MNRKIKIPAMAIILVIIILIVAIIIILSKKKNIKKVEPQTNNNEPKQSRRIESTDDEIMIVPTMNDEISSNSAWCATFQLVWNDMKNEVVKQDIVFTPQLEIVENLNKEDFDESMISDEYYYKKYGLKTLDLKEEIERGIKEKFNQTSDILDLFDWSNDDLDDSNNPDVKRYFFYTMLYRNFEFINKFDKLENGRFGDNYNDVEYFGIDGQTNEVVGNQINVLYYNSKDDFAIVINTKSDDEVIFCKNPEGHTFNEIYDNMNNKAERYNDNSNFEEIDEFKAPKINFDELKEYDELENKEFETANGVAQITKAMQTIKFSLDEKGGEIKSEAAIGMYETTAVFEPEIEEKKPRYFYVDDTFAIFLREKHKEKPYFAAVVDDITELQ